MKWEKNFKIIYAILFVSPLILGATSYLYEGKNILDSLYYSIVLYGFGFEGEDSPILGLEIARWAAPLMTATSLLMIFKSIFAYLRVHILALTKESNIVYGTSVYGKALCDTEKKVLFCEKEPVRYGKNHFIMFESDTDNFSFFQKYRKSFVGKNVYICLNEINSTLLKTKFSKNINVKFFNPNDVIARGFWKERQLWNDTKREWKIAIVGFEGLGRRILERALQLNIFSITQQIEYYVFGNYKQFEMTHSSMELMNQDKILYYDKDSEEQWKLFKSMDMIIVTERMDIDLLQQILGYTSSKTYVYYYNPGNDNISQYIETERIIPYGHNQVVFNLENIKTDKLYENAICLNQLYVNKHNGVAWNELTGFEKESNVSSADYGEIIQLLYKKGLSEKELAELEHCRWCRFHFLHYWSYGIPNDGTNKSERDKIHKSLISYDKLDENSQNKTLEVIRMWKELT